MIKNFSLFVVFILLLGCTGQDANNNIPVINGTINETTNVSEPINQTSVLPQVNESGTANATVELVINNTMENVSKANYSYLNNEILPGFKFCGALRDVTFVPVNVESSTINQCFSDYLKNCSHVQVIDDSESFSGIYTIVGKVQNVCLLHVKKVSATATSSSVVCEIKSDISYYLPNEFEGRRSVWLLKKAVATGKYNSSRTQKVYTLHCDSYSESYVPAIYNNIETGLPFSYYGADFYSDKAGTLGWLHTSAVLGKKLRDTLPGYVDPDKKGSDILSLVSIKTGKFSSKGRAADYNDLSFQYVFNNDRTKCVWFKMPVLAAPEVAANGAISNCNKNGSPLTDNEIIKNWNYDSDDMLPYTSGLSNYNITEIYFQMRDLKNYQGPLFFDSIALQKINEFEDNVPIMVVQFEPNSDSKGPGYLLYNMKTGKLINGGGYYAHNFDSQREGYKAQ